ncbi:hypothetical protein Pint_30219 [Pistacia integerrima]|uniref:Uncharacterized protein n=1 Tax=Pistacia integerrima TaxID=434235 RepID=A0ACC0WY45_9ROSI|nr:hypothetical protein Pint_30219 [Pistacia integerrima]
MLASLDSTAQTGQANGGDWQEEVYQKIKAMKDMYFPELNDMYNKIATKLQQHDSLPQQPKSEQLEKLKIFKTMLERIITFLQVSKSNISPNFREKLGSYEKQIINFINTNRPRKPVSSLQPGQLPPPHMHSMQQPQSQLTQVQPHDNQMNSQMQSMNLQGSVGTMPQNNMTNMQHKSMSSMSGVSTASQNMSNSLQPGSNLDSGQGNSLNSLHQVSVGSLQQNSVGTSQQANMNTLSSQSGVNMLPSNINPLQSNSNMLQHQHMKQEQQQMLQSQQLKQQMQQRQIQHQMMQKQQLMQQQQQQQLHQQAKQQLPGQMQTHQMPQLHQMNDVSDMKMRQGMGVKPGVFQQHLLSSQCSVYPHQQLKPGATFPISSPQMVQAASPQMPQHSSPQVDQQNLLSSLTKTGTPLQSASSPLIVPSPSTPLAPSPMPGDSDKPISGISSQANAGNIAHQLNSNTQAAAMSVAIGTPGISAAPLLAEFTGPDGTHGNSLTTVSGKSRTGMQNQVHNQGQSLRIPLSANQSQPCQQLFSQYIQNNMTSTGLPGSSGLPFLLPSVSGLTKTPIPSVANQNSTMQNISVVSQNTLPSMGQGVPSNLFANSQREMQAMLQVLPLLQQHQSQNPQQHMHQQHMPSKAAFTKPAAPITLPSMMPSQKQQQQLMGQLSKAANMPQNQLIGQQYSVGDVEQQLHQRLLGQKSNLPKLQQQINHALIFCVFFVSVLLWFLYLV